MTHAGARGDRLGEGPLGADVHQVRLQVRMSVQEGFDLDQGRDAGGSGGAVFVKDCTIGPENILHILFADNPSHRFSIP